MVVSRITPFLGFLRDLEVLPPVIAGGLQVFGLRLPPRRAKAPYRTLEDALAAKTLVVSEVMTLGVQALRAMNAGRSMVLLLKGDRLTGHGHEFRVSASILLGPQETVKVPVERIESAPLPPAQPPPPPPPVALPRIAVPRDASGAIFAAGGQVAAVELFDRKDTLRKRWPRVLEAGASLAAGFPGAEGAGLQEASFQENGAAAWLLQTMAAAVETRASPGLGLSLAIRGGNFSGECLLFENEPIHLVLACASHPAEEPLPGAPGVPGGGRVSPGASRLEPGLPGNRYLPAAGDLGGTSV